MSPRTPNRSAPLPETPLARSTLRGRLRLDNGDSPSIAWPSGNGTNCAYRDATGWHTAVAIAHGFDDAKLTVTADGVPHIAVAGGDDGLLYAAKVAGTWHTTVVDAPHNDILRVGGIGVHAGNVLISYTRQEPGAPDDGPPFVWFVHGMP